MISVSSISKERFSPEIPGSWVRLIKLTLNDFPSVPSTSKQTEETGAARGSSLAGSF